MATVQRLLIDWSRRLPGNSAQRATAALSAVRQLADAGAGFVAEHPGLRRQLAAMARESPDQIAHEFLTEHWQPHHSSEVIDRLAGVGCRFIGSATAIENIDAISIPGSVQPLLDGVTDIGLRETMKDAARNQSLRRDLFQRGDHAFTGSEHRRALNAMRLAALPGAPREGGLTLDTRIGPIQAPAELFGPALAELAQGPQHFDDLARLPAYAHQIGALNIVLQTLLWAGCAHPYPGFPVSAACARLNAHLRTCAATPWRAEPAFGGALAAHLPQ